MGSWLQFSDTVAAVMWRAEPAPSELSGEAARCGRRTWKLAPSSYLPSNERGSDKPADGLCNRKRGRGSPAE